MRSSSVVILLFLAILLGSCAVTSGSTFSSALLSETDSEGDDEPQPPDSEDVLTIRSNPSGATVWIDNREQGTTPFSSEDIEPGRYRLRLEKQGYYPESRWIELGPASALVLEIDLEAITGYLVVTTVPPDAAVTIDGEPLGAVGEIPIGRYRVTARRFGYEARSERVEVREAQTTRVELELTEAEFAVTQLRTSRNRFNPGSPGALGRTVVSFEVTAPGSGRVRVSRQDELIEAFTTARFESWEQSFGWPRASTPELADGEYTIELELVGDDGVAVLKQVTAVVDSTLQISPALVWSNAPGLLYAPMLNPLPSTTIQLSLAGAGVATQLNEQPVSRFPLRISGRFGLGLNTEAVVHAGITTNSLTTSDRISAGATVLWGSPTLGTSGFNVGTGLMLGATYRTPDASGLYAGSDTLTNFPGFWVMVPLQARVGPVAVAGAAQYHLSPARVHYDESLPPNAWTQTLYGRGGLRVDVGPVRAGLSFAARSTPLDSGLSLDLPVAAGLEMSWLLAKQPIVVSGFASGEFESFRDFYIMGGAALSILF